ncbi:MazG nucleotide pyrophosphohydrolase domain-containing protein [Allorhizobium taibaishanense]|uniref:Pyrophosphatase n=1 Tax=Allorhizobium taibaishanense TaxID=887144 RepID=A0A1Q9AAI7_9HYPH|nr:MazG nucleotide pyrophosphohydrolase domain-containing protein [Allorhizobium taibaishanense]MBB4007043.1 NTP pyrophosphatase (non-canonical NTP hydrolase) [Allorhizobium taibaishanense]OLP51852.1 pyrophosphatase [Allorhizobium taibaishanense]
MFSKLMEQFEAASAVYANANGITRDPDWFLLKLIEEAGEVTQAANRLSGRSRAKGMGEAERRQLLADETADLLGHVLLFARHHSLDLEEAIARKWRFDPRKVTADP